LYLTGAAPPDARHLLDSGLIGLIATPKQTGTGLSAGWIWAADNGCFNAKTYVGDLRWFSWLADNAPHASRCLFATAPDVVGDHAATLARSLPWLPRIRSLGYPAAFVAQNGATVDNVPWDAFDVLFIGGDTEWKLGPDAQSLTFHAKGVGKRVHMGRVNLQPQTTTARLRDGVRHRRRNVHRLRTCDQLRTPRALDRSTSRRTTPPTLTGARP
jgi:hypothetical protein